VIRSGIVMSAALAAVLLPIQAFASQTQARSFAGLAAYYPGRGAGLTAAHRTLPFGTRVRVTDPKTGRSVIVRITDRGPFGRGRVLDVCVGAARVLGMIDRGVIYVRADVL
jgi:rare lipoprotein A (peptidoglycan hydrolase)